MTGTSTGEEPDRHTPRRWAASRHLGILLVIALLACGVGTLMTSQKVHDRSQRQDEERAALAAGRTAAVAFTSYDYRHLHQDLGRVQDMSTGPFRKQFTSALSALTDGISAAHGVSVGTVVDAGLVTSDPDRVVVMAAVDAVVRNTASTSASTRRYRLKITLSHDSGSWLISDIAPVS